MTNNTPASEVPWTPGSWSYRYDGEHWNDKDSFYVVANPSGRIGGQRDIALVLGDHTQGKTEANARLIAESPTMAALLDEVTTLAEMWRNRLGHDVADYPAITSARECLNRIRSVK